MMPYAWLNEKLPVNATVSNNASSTFTLLAR